MTTISPTRLDRSRARDTIRKARNELLASGDPALRPCYDYLQTAQEKVHDADGSAIFDLYKAIETVENALGGEEAACEELGVRKELKSIKRTANEPSRDERHAPEDPAQPRVPKEHGLAMDHTRAVVRAYERYLQRRSRP